MITEKDLKDLEIVFTYARQTCVQNETVTKKLTNKKK